MINPCFVAFCYARFCEAKSRSLCQNTDEIVFDLHSLIESMELELLSFLSFQKNIKILISGHTRFHA
ncbi:MAG: hypothetical protein SPJ83_02495 [Helicobacter sp.]|uniref:hypothetical protein n=1 Tax=Helicobacter sp. TaxID=218 RepID=UPI002A9111E1|nr:hypothetical protein [Helicobacter sp.]MDY5821658.1 hypothetical protein [Helicobacter sp.]